MNRTLLGISTILILATSLALAPTSAIAAGVSWAEIDGDFVIIDGSPPAANTAATGSNARSKRARQPVRWRTASSTQLYRITDYPYQEEAEMIRLSDMTNLLHIGFPAAREQYGTGAGVVIAIVDTGVADLPVFQGRLLRGYNARTRKPMVGDVNGHGTQVASIAAASMNDRDAYVGVAPEAMILPIGVMSPKGEGTDADIARGIVYAAKNGADIINISLGGNGSSKVLHDAMVWARKQGSILVCAAGNSGVSILDYPGSDPACIPVRASDEDRARAEYSSYGLSLNGLSRGLTAPGYGWTATREGDIDMFMGTSAATPHVAGVLALLLSRGETEKDLYKYVSDGGAPGIDPDYGHGFLDLNRVHEPALCPMKTVTLWVPHGGDTSSNQLPQCFNRYELKVLTRPQRGELLDGKYYHYNPAKTLADQMVIRLTSREDTNLSQTVVINLRTRALQGVLWAGKKRCTVYKACRLPLNKIPSFTFALGKQYSPLWDQRRPVKMKIIRTSDGAYADFIFKKWKKPIRSNVLQDVEFEEGLLYTVQFEQGGISTPAYAIDVIEPTKPVGKGKVKKSW